MVEPKTAAPLFAMYSEKIKSVDELKDGDTIALCSDASNKARGLHLLESQGLITLDDSVETPTQYDIKENKLNLKFIEADMQVLPQSLPDVAAILCAAAHMINAGLVEQIMYALLMMQNIRCRICGKKRRQRC